MISAIDTFIRSFSPDLALDDRWIMVKPNGPDAKGAHMLIGEGGEVKAGAGGKFNGQKINEIPRTFENKQYTGGNGATSSSSLGKGKSSNSEPQAKNTPATKTKEEHNKNFLSVVNNIGESGKIPDNAIQAYKDFDNEINSGKLGSNSKSDYEIKKHLLDVAERSLELERKEYESKNVSRTVTPEYKEEYSKIGYEGMKNKMAAEREQFARRKRNILRAKRINDVEKITGGGHALDVPYADKDLAKASGARWEPQTKTWYVPKGAGKEKFAKWEIGTDSNVIAFDKSSVRTVDPNGFLRVSVSNISRECVNPYYGKEIPGNSELGLDPERIYQGYRKGSELEKAAESFNGLPLLLDHHFESATNPQKEYRVGSLGTDVRFESPFLKSSLIVTDAKGIDAIESGEAMELSCAYRYKPVFEPGTFDGSPYDFVMTEIQGNHCSLVAEGRAGSDVIVADAQINPNPQKRGIVKMGMEKFVDKLKGLLALAEKAESEQDPEFQEAGKEILGDMEPIFAGDPEKKPAEDEDEDMMKHPWYAAASEEARDVFDKINAKKDEELMAEIEARLGKGEPVDDELPIEIVEQMKAAGLDPENEELAKAFMSGMKANEKGEGEDCDMPGKEQKAGMDEEAVKEKEKEEIFTAQDAAIRIARASAQAENRAIAKMRSLYKAAGEVESLCGKLEPLAFDSASGIYAHALKAIGRKTATQDESALREMVAMAADAKHAALSPAYPKFENTTGLSST